MKIFSPYFQVEIKNEIEVQELNSNDYGSEKLEQEFIRARKFEDNFNVF